MEYKNTVTFGRASRGVDTGVLAQFAEAGLTGRVSHTLPGTAAVLASLTTGRGRGGR